MHPVVIDKPYSFVPPHLGTWWPRFLQLFGRRKLRREYGLVDVSGKGTIDFNAFVTFYNKLVNHQLMKLVNKQKNLQWTAEMGEFEKASAADFFSCTTEQKLGYLRLGQ